MANKLPGELAPLSSERTMNRILGAGPTFAFTFSGTGDVKSVSVSAGLSKVNQAIHNILSTRKGERVYRPTYGCFSGDTKILMANGRQIPIQELVGKRVITFGTKEIEASSHSPKAAGIFQVNIRNGAVSQGVKQTVILHLSNGEDVCCTPDHQFLLDDFKTYAPAAGVEGFGLAWLDVYAPHFRGRVFASSSSKGNYLGNLPTSSSKLSVVGVSEGEEVEVFDLVDSPTRNFTLGCGPIVHNSNLHKLVFEPNDEVLFAQLKYEVAEALRAWERRIRVRRVTPMNGGSYSTKQLLGNGYTNESIEFLDDPNMVGIYIEYEILKTHQIYSYVYPFYRETASVSFNLGLRGPTGEV